MDEAADNNSGAAAAPRDDEGSAVDEDSVGDLVHQWEAIVLDAESDGEEDESFNIDEHEEDLTDDEFEYDCDEGIVECIFVRSKGWVSSNLTRTTLGDESKALLFWRTSDEKSFSDWTIKVVTEKEDGIEDSMMYNVHRVALALEPKKSGYFEALLQSDSFSESSECMNTVTLPEELAAHFPDFLDYMYSQPLESKAIINFENWKPMMCLANYFLVSALTEDVLGFIEKDMYNLDHMEDYLSELDDINADVSKRILPKATRVCAELILSIEVDSSLLKVISPAMFLYIISTLRYVKISARTEKYRYHVCGLIIEYLESIEDESYCYALSGLMNETLFWGYDEMTVGDDEMTVQRALDLLQLMRRKGWKNDWFSLACTDSLRSYLLYGKIPAFSLIHRIMKEVHTDIAARYITSALLERSFEEEQQETSGGLRFEINIFRNGRRIPWGVRELPVVSSIETISELKERLALELGVEDGCHLLMALTHNDVILDNAETIASYQISPDENLIKVELDV